MLDFLIEKLGKFIYKIKCFIKWMCEGDDEGEDK